MPVSLAISNWNFSRKLKLEKKKKSESLVPGREGTCFQEKRFHTSGHLRETADRSIMGKDYHDGTA